MRENARRVLLTGATGALGPSLAAELLASDPARRLDILIRDGKTGIQARFEQWLESVAIELAHISTPINPNWRERIQPIPADLRIDGLGLSTAARSELLRNTTTIVHAAADTQFLSSYDDLWATNVEGTRRIIELARQCRSMPRLVQVSTVCTSGTNTGSIPEQSCIPAPRFVNNYERTKWESEQLALASEVPLGIARISIVIGSNASGIVHRMGAFHHLVRWVIRGLVPVIPGTDRTMVDLISTETAAQFISRAIVAKWESGSIWHVAAGDRAASLHGLGRQVWKHAFPGQPLNSREHPGHPFIVDHETFDQQRLTKTSPRQRLVRQAMDCVSSFLPMLMYPRTYDTTQAEKLWGGELPCPDWRQTLDRMFETMDLGLRRETAA